ncbi:hypothetical protein MCOR27_005587 [Pyricularia oryzae]|uniref:AB hydrolase-1 domain-containing protein n=5 Tax=Pyricularia TaxID=48558 RepID=A0ABQ8NS24_PYRGI|nr:uncharacterized protein MGG_08007 [Pyricularia oryzae 70-15]ELQ33514.1 hypothetical protein OOU_Y34scaffold00927g3 [Pyricularia oryzae Y34]KAH8839358.1 hypothetical protein MCOR01_008563 [Pyricularia oryzae]KAI6301262.1 hypothetical protein MCOR33_003209 [Pyricularia grisea]EHA55151.1 hypothetical protein MGG_08007 [Pyricularia oryzae 70-15]KAH9439206.1 hypothetical protein MCOR02_002776 [Pyricularia oryzae]
MSAPNKTAIILVHGAWHTPSHLEGLAEPLRKDFLVDAPALDTSGPADVVRSKGLQDNVAAVLKMIQPHLDAGREVVVVAHSAGGVTVPEAVAGNTVQERRAKGLDGGVKAVIFIASLLVLPGGISLAEQAGRMPSEPWYETVDGALVLNPGAENIFYNDIDEAKALEAIEKTTCQSTRLFTDKVEHGSLSIQAPMTYIVCEKDVCILPAVLNMMADGLGDKCTKVSLDCGHTPWMRNDVLPKLVNVVVEAARA